MPGKIFSDIYTESARDTGDETTSHITYVKKKANDALRDICAEMAYSWLQRSVSLPLVASQQAYVIADVAPTWDEDTPIGLYYRGSDSRRIYLALQDDNEWREQENTREGDSYCFNVNMRSGEWKAYLSLVPSSNFVSAYSPMTMDYQKKPTELSTGADIPELPTNHHQGLVYWTNSLICSEMGDINGAADWMARAKKSIGLMKKKQVHRAGRPKRAYPRGYLRGSEGYRPRDYNR